MTVAVVIPTRDEAGEVVEVVAHALALGADEVVVADGASTDGTRELAERAGARVVLHGGGRAAQCNAGVRATSAEVVVFLHADSRLPAGGLDAIRRALDDPAVGGGNFALRFGSGSPDRFTRTLAVVYRVQRRLGFYYGDSSVWCRRAVFEALGGFRALPIMDDYDFVRRLERATTTRCLPGPAITSDRRWRTIGVGRTVFSWVVIRWLYVLGVSPARLARLYRRIR